MEAKLESCFGRIDGKLTIRTSRTWRRLIQYKVSAKVGELSTGKQTLARLLAGANGGG